MSKTLSKLAAKTFQALASTPLPTKCIQLALSASLSLVATTSFGSASFLSLTQDDYDKITKEFSGNFVHPSVSGADSLGKLFGVETSLVLGQTASPNIDSIVKRSGSSSGLSNLYDGGVLIALTVPLGFTGEIVYVPKTTASDASFQMTSLGLKWTASESVLILPVNLAFRGIYTSSEFSFNQTLSAANATVTNKNTVTGLQVLVSPKLPIVEPYFGIGMLSASNTLSVTGSSGTIFDSTLTTSQSSDNKASSTQLIAGINAKLLLFSLGAEYSKAFDASRYAVKFGFAF